MRGAGTGLARLAVMLCDSRRGRWGGRGLPKDGDGDPVAAEQPKKPVQPGLGGVSASPQEYGPPDHFRDIQQRRVHVASSSAAHDGVEGELM